MSKIELNQLKKIVSNLSGIPQEEIHEDTALIEDLQLDSLKFVELMAIIGEEYGAVIEEDDSMSLQTIGHIYQFVNKDPI